MKGFTSEPSGIGWSALSQREASKRPGLDIQKEIRDFPAGKFPLQNSGSRLREQRISDDRIVCEGRRGGRRGRGNSGQDSDQQQEIEFLYCAHW